MSDMWRRETSGDMARLLSLAGAGPGIAPGQLSAVRLEVTLLPRAYQNVQLLLHGL